MVAHASSELQYIVPELLLECLDARIQTLVYSRLEDLGNHLLVIYSCGDEQRYQIREVGPSRSCTTLAQALKVAPPGYVARYIVRCFGAPSDVIPPGIPAAPSVPYALARVVLLADHPAADAAQKTTAPGATPVTAEKSEIRPPVRTPIQLASTPAPTVAKPEPAKVEKPAPVPAAAVTPTAEVTPVLKPTPGAEVKPAVPASTELRQGIQDFRKILESRENALRDRETRAAALEADVATRDKSLTAAAARVAAAQSATATATAAIAARETELVVGLKALAEKTAAVAVAEKAIAAEKTQVAAAGKALAIRESEAAAALKHIEDKTGLLAAVERDLLARKSTADATDASLRKREDADAAIERDLLARNEALEKEIAGLLSLLQEFSGADHA